MESELASLLGSLAALGRSLGGAFDPQHFLGEFSSRVQPLVPHDRMMIVYREEGGTLSVFAEHALRGPILHAGRYSIAFDPGGRYTPEELALGSVLAGEPMLVPDLLADPPHPGAELARLPSRAIGLRSRLAVPLTGGGRVVGALLVASFTPDQYSAEHVRIARLIADLIGPFIENIVLLHREQRRRTRLAGLAGLACVFSSSLNLRETFDRLAAGVRPTLDFDGMGVRIVGASGRDVELVGWADAESAAEVPSRLPLEHLSFSGAVEAGDPLLVRDASLELDPGCPGDRVLLARGIRSCLVAPLWFCSEVGGFLFFGKRRPQWYDSGDAEVAAAIAAQVVVALQHQRLAEEQQQRAQAEGQARRLAQHVEALRTELGERYGFDRIIGRAPSLREALGQAAKVAPLETAVLLTGETGTGKELVARAIHFDSPRARGPFVAVNCAAIPETLVESELFGHEKGAFTGADKQKPGRFELAAGGTLFLDEVGELPPSAQAKLLRVLEQREFQRVGGTVTLRAEVRLIAATNRDLQRAVEGRKFREDLYYRLNVFPVHLPPLRERGGDVLLLANHFVHELGPRMGKGEPGLSREARDLLLAYRWPGNIRELKNAVERALILAEGGLLTAAHFGLGGSEEPLSERSRSPEADSTVPSSLPAIERHTILTALERARGNKTKAAAALGITRTKLYTRLKHFGLAS
jgi:transcriptional regulator with GAF, ATPase, and Fis domain